MKDPDTGLPDVKSWDWVQELLEHKLKLIQEEAGATDLLLFFTNTKRINKLLNKERVRQEQPVKEYIPNFREAIAVQKEYKGDRKAEKPFHFYNLLAHMLSSYQHYIGESGLEADDYLCLHQIATAKKYGVRVPFHAGHYLLDYEDWLKFGHMTFGLSGGYLKNQKYVDGTYVHTALHSLILPTNPGEVVDHVNGDKLDNRKYNLRVCTPKQNRHNSKPQAGSSSQYKGVNWNKGKGKWESSIRVDGKLIFLGNSLDEEVAARLYDKAAKENFGEYARLNFEKPCVKPYKETIICSRDKDLRQCPLWHYSWEMGKQAAIGPLFVEPLGMLEKRNEGQKYVNGKSKPISLFGTGHKFFYAQMLMGDKVDSIGGVEGRGPAFAYNLLHEAETERECYELVAEIYVKSYGDDWKVRMKEQADLLHMVRELNEDGSPKLWLPPRREQ